MYDIITFGSATQDVFLKSNVFTEIKEEKKFFNQRGVCFALGGKIPISSVEFQSGGGGTNTAFTFNKQKFKVAYCGMVGEDYAGREIENELKKNKISGEFLFFTKKKHTNYSIVLSTKSDRTVLVYRGASEELKINDIPWQKLKTKWFYLAPLSGKLSNLFEIILSFAKKNNIKVAINPGNSQLLMPRQKIKKLLNMADILFLNQEEASLVTKIPYNREKEIFCTLDEWVDGIVVMTKGPLGVVVSDGKYFYKSSILSTRKVVDRTGCGDAFGSGFVSAIIKRTINKNYKKIVPKGLNPTDIEYAIQYGSANATSCTQEFGAKNGLLEGSKNLYKWGRLKIERVRIKEHC